MKGKNRSFRYVVRGGELKKIQIGSLCESFWNLWSKLQIDNHE